MMLIKVVVSKTNIKFVLINSQIGKTNKTNVTIIHETAI